MEPISYTIYCVYVEYTLTVCIHHVLYTGRPNLKASFIPADSDDEEEGADDRSTTNRRKPKTVAKAFSRRTPSGAAGTNKKVVPYNSDSLDDSSLDERDYKSRRDTTTNANTNTRQDDSDVSPMRQGGREYDSSSQSELETNKKFR